MNTSKICTTRRAALDTLTVRSACWNLIEEEEKPEKIFCPEIDGKTHIIDVDMPCATHQQNRPIGNLIKAMIMLHHALKRGGRKLKPADVDIPAIKTYLCEGRTILPLSLLAALTLDTMSRGSHEYSEDDLVMMPHYVLIVYDKLLKSRKER